MLIYGGGGGGALLDHYFEVTKLRVKMEINCRVGYMQRSAIMEEGKNMIGVGKLRKEVCRRAYEDRTNKEWKVVYMT